MPRWVHLPILQTVKWCVRAIREALGLGKGTEQCSEVLRSTRHSIKGLLAKRERKGPKSNFLRREKDREGSGFDPYGPHTSDIGSAGGNKERGKPSDPEIRSFEGMIEAFLAERPAPKRNREYGIRNNLLRTFAGMDVFEIHPEQVLRHEIRRLVQDGIASNTINKEVSFLSQAFRHAQTEWGWPVDNPAYGCRIPGQPGGNCWLTRGEVKALLKTAKGHTASPYLFDFIRLALALGLRHSELLELKWENVDWEKRILYFRPKKSARTWAVKRLTPTALRALRALRAWVDRHCPHSCWVFAKSNGERVQDAGQAFRTVRKKAEIGYCRIHDLRHTYATWKSLSGQDPKEIQHVLGHASFRSTQTYIHAHPHPSE